MSKLILIALLCLAYPVFAHASIASGQIYLAWLAWLSLVVLVCLALPSRWRMPAGIVLAAPLFLMDANALLRAAPVAFDLALFAWFWKSLGPGEEPVISWFARLERGELDTELARYSRRLTAIWAILFAMMALLSAWLAVFGSPEAWSVFTNGVSYVLMGALFFGEYLYRRVRYHQYAHASLPRMIRMLFKIGAMSARRAEKK